MKNDRTISLKNLHAILEATTKVESVSFKEFESGPPKFGLRGECVDFIFVRIFVNSRAETYRAEIEKIILASTELNNFVGEFPCFDLIDLINVDNWKIHEKEDKLVRVLRFAALGQALGLWKIVTPATLNFTGSEAYRLAEDGLLKIIRIQTSEQRRQRTSIVAMAR
ncbi:MAG: hypothetical protein AAB507_01940 [Patescibacteria group bacterium]